MNADFLTLIQAVASRTSVSPRLITLSFGIDDDGVAGWTATLVVITGKARKPTVPAPRKTFIGWNADPAAALAEAEQGHAEWKDPNIVKERQKRATLAEFAQDDPELAAKLRAKGAID